jgi:hypothetical protein
MNNISHIENNPLLLIETMAAYVISGKAKKNLVAAEEIMGPYRLRLICISLLSWLKSLSGISKIRRMRIKEAGSAKESLIHLLSADSCFSSVFVNEGEDILLNPELKQHQVDEIIATADQLYSPRRFITRRREDSSDQ